MYQKNPKNTHDFHICPSVTVHGTPGPALYMDLSVIREGVPSDAEVSDVQGSYVRSGKKVKYYTDQHLILVVFGLDIKNLGM